MLAIRMQRTGRSGHTMFRLIVQDSRRSPSRGKIVTQLGHYDPHQKTLVVEKEKTAFFLEHGAHPSDRVARLFKTEGIALPKWVHLEKNNPRPVKNTAKLRRNQLAGSDVEKAALKTKIQTVAETKSAEEDTPIQAEETTSEEITELPADSPTEPVTEINTETAEKN